MGRKATKETVSSLSRAFDTSRIPKVLPDAAPGAEKDLILPLAGAVGHAARTSPSLYTVLHCLSEVESAGLSTEQAAEISSSVSEAVVALCNDLADRGDFGLTLLVLKAARKAESVELQDRCWPNLGTKLPTSLNRDALGHISSPDLLRALETDEAKDHKALLILDIIEEHIELAMGARYDSAGQSFPFNVAQGLVAKILPFERISREALAVLQDRRLYFLSEASFTEMLASIVGDRLPFRYVLYKIQQFPSDRRMDASDAKKAIRRLFKVVAGLGIDIADMKMVLACPLFPWDDRLTKKLTMDMIDILHKPFAEQTAPNGYVFAARSRRTPVAVAVGTARATAHVCLFSSTEADPSSLVPLTSAQICEEITKQLPALGFPHPHRATGPIRFHPADGGCTTIGDSEIVATPETLRAQGTFEATVTQNA